jgi:uncharacterized protein YuzE
MLIVRSHNGVPVHLTEERWQHIMSRHPEMKEHRDRVLETLVEPDMIQEGDFGEQLAVRFYAETPLTSKYLVVAYREVSAEDGFIQLLEQPTIGKETSTMEAIKILEKPSPITWDYDEEADVLYLVIGKPQPAVGLDIGEGVIVRYDEVHKEVVGLTLIGLRARLLKSLTMP